MHRPVREVFASMDCRELREWRIAYELGLYQPEIVHARGYACLCNLWLAKGAERFAPSDFLPGETRGKKPADAATIAAKMEAFAGTMKHGDSR